MLPANPITELISARRLAGDALLDLTISNPLAVGIDYPHQQIAAILGSIKDFGYGPLPFGELPARQAVCLYYEQRSVLVAPDRVALTASTSEAYSLLFKLFCDPGSEILVPTPSYPLFDYLAGLESARAIPYRLDYDGCWFIDFDHLRESISPLTRAIVVVSPNNPTGSYLKTFEKESLSAIAREFSLPIICDEVFMDYPLSSSRSRCKSLAETDAVLSFSLNGLSKVAGMPQLKLGWIVINGPDKQVKSAKERLELLLDTYLSVNTPVQRALPELLQLGKGIWRQLQNRVAENLATVHTLLLNSAASCLYLEGGWSAIIQLPHTASEEVWVTELLQFHGVAVQPGYFFDMPEGSYIIVSLITPSDPLSTGIKRVLQLLESKQSSLTPS